MTASTRFEGVLGGYLYAHGWRFARCTGCGREYFAKDADVCAGPDCPLSRGLAAPRPGSGQAVATQWDRLHRVLARRKLVPFAMDDLGGVARDTDLIVSALQYLDPVVHEGRAAPQGMQILAQPCVRWRYLGTAGREEGVSTSFVNLSSLEVGSLDLIDRLVVHLDLWLQALSGLGVNARGVTIALTPEDCEYGPYAGRRADVHLAGVEIGEINWYHRVDDAAGRPMTVIDCGFAFERIAWVAAGGASYHSMLSPLFTGSPAGGPVVNDRARTLALLALNGITPGNRGPRRYARQLADELAVPFLSGLNVPGYLDHAVRFWRQFLGAGRPGASRAASAAVERQAALRLAAELGQPSPPRELDFGGAMDFLAGRSGGPPAVERAARTLIGV